MWSHCAPAEDIIVVSEIGEQWSPQTEPARQADIHTIPSWLPTGKIARTIGIRIPNVPQEVPVAKDIPQAARNIIAGKKVFQPSALARAAFTKVSDSKRPVIFLSDVANVKIKIAGTIALKPLGIQAIACLNVTSLLAIK